MTKILDGKMISTLIKEEVKAEVESLKEQSLTPHLAVFNYRK